MGRSGREKTRFVEGEGLRQKRAFQGMPFRAQGAAFLDGAEMFPAFQSGKL